MNNFMRETILFVFQFLSANFHSCWEHVFMAGEYIKEIDLSILKQGLCTLALSFYDAAVMIENSAGVLAEYDVLLLSGDSLLNLSSDPDSGVHLMTRFRDSGVSFALRIHY
jgi:hypothetical protein